MCWKSSRHKDGQLIMRQTGGPCIPIVESQPLLHASRSATTPRYEGDPVMADRWRCALSVVGQPVSDTLPRAKPPGWGPTRASPRPS
eukprot:2463012-Prymnesium_polylepis.1